MYVMIIHANKKSNVCSIQGDLVDAIADPQEGWQFGENIRTGK